MKCLCGGGMPAAREVISRSDTRFGDRMQTQSPGSGLPTGKVSCPPEPAFSSQKINSAVAMKGT